MVSRKAKHRRESKPAPELHLVGLNHETAPGAVRELLAYGEPEASRWVRLAVEEGAVDLGGPRIQEAVLVSTCNRTEAYLVLSGEDAPPPSSDLAPRLVRLLCASHPEVASSHGDVFYHRTGPDAARHLLRVAAGLDSMVQGEAQILGQVHRAHELAREADGIGPILDRLFSSAFHAGKRSRSETEIGKGAVSVASAAVALAAKVVGNLARRTILVVGAGETGTLVARHLANESPHGLLVANRTLARAEALAQEVGGRALSLDRLPEALAEADVVLVAASSPTPVLSLDLAREAAHHRRRSTVYIDISIPRNVDPAVHQLDGAFLYDMDALQKIVEENLARREQEGLKVEVILEEELRLFRRWIASLAAGPTIAQLRERFEELRQEEIRRHAGKLGPEELQAVERVTRGLLNKILHGPTIHLRHRGSAEPESLEAVRRMFQLDPAPGEEAPNTVDDTSSSVGEAGRAGHDRASSASDADDVEEAGAEPDRRHDNRGPETRRAVEEPISRRPETAADWGTEGAS